MDSMSAMDGSSIAAPPLVMQNLTTGAATFTDLAAPTDKRELCGSKAPFTDSKNEEALNMKNLNHNQQPEDNENMTGKQMIAVILLFIIL